MHEQSIDDDMMDVDHSEHLADDVMEDGRQTTEETKQSIDLFIEYRPNVMGIVGWDDIDDHEEFSKITYGLTI